MPVTDPLQGATFLPAWTDPYQAPQTLADMYEFLLTRGITRFTTTAERDAAYPSPATGQTAFADGRLWIYSTTWKRLWSAPVDWTSTGVTAGSGVTLSNVAYKVSTDDTVNWRGEVYGASAPGTNDILINYPAGIAPLARLADGIFGLGGGSTVFVGNFGGTGELEKVRYRSLIFGAWPTTATLGLSLNGLSWSRA